MKCSNCGLDNPAGTTECGRCKSPLDRRPRGGDRARPTSAVMLGMGLLLAAGAAAALLRSGGGSQQGSGVFVRNDAPASSDGVAAETETEPEASALPTEPPLQAPQATATAEPPAERGGERPRHEIMRVVRQNMKQTRTCYERGLAKNPKLSGRVNVRFTISPEGNVVVASSDSALADPDVTQCVVAVFRAMSFPPSAGGPVTVSYPVVLQAE